MLYILKKVHTYNVSKKSLMLWLSTKRNNCHINYTTFHFYVLTVHLRISSFFSMQMKGCAIETTTISFLRQPEHKHFFVRSRISILLRFKILLSLTMVSSGIVESPECGFHNVKLGELQFSLISNGLFLRQLPDIDDFVGIVGNQKSQNKVFFNDRLKNLGQTEKLILMVAFGSTLSSR